MWYALCSIIGIITGCALTSMRKRSKAIGELQIISSEGEEPYLFLQLDKEVPNLYKYRYVSMKITKKRVNSQG